MNYQLIHEIIDQIADFQKEHTEGDLQDFSTWLSHKIGRNAKQAEIQVQHAPSIDINDAIPEFIICMYRYAKIYVKKILEENHSAFSTYDEVIYVIVLFFNPEKMTKTELIEKNVHEKPTGMEILKRLLKNNMIEQYDNEQDKRSKYLKVTEKGKMEFLKIFDKMREVSRLIAGDLTVKEQGQLYFLLKKLDNFHNPIFLNERALGIDELLTKLGEN
jgi:MarR family transcriptional regulator, lower aerobic nicotinate degradation pathway regulator